MAKTLGIDYGDKRIGIAISDDNNKVSFSRPHLSNDTKLFKKISEIIQTENVNRIILGYPINLNYEKSIQTLKTEDFKKSLETFLSKLGLQVEIFFSDERFTSSIAGQFISENVTNKKKKKDKGLVDSISAQIILQGYLDKINFKH